MPRHRVATVDSPLDHGGKVTSGSPKHKADGKAVARVGDTAVCDQHGTVTIVTGSPKHTVDGKACARVTSVCSCGAKITDGSRLYTCS